MARYCFYCGRQLSAGEKCGCRNTGKTSQSQQTQTSQSTQQSQQNEQNRGSQQNRGGQQQKQQARPGHAEQASGQAKTAGRQPRNLWRRLVAFFNPFAGPTGRTAAAGRNKAGGSPRQTAQAANSRGKSGWPDRQALTAALYQAGRYFVRPVERIRQTVQSGSRTAVLVILLLNGITGGFFLVLAAAQPHLQAVLSLNIAVVNNGTRFISQLFLFIQGFGISLAANLLLTLLYQLVLRYVFHQPAGFMRLLNSLSPAVFYSTLFLLGGMLTLMGSPFSALLMAAAGFALSALAQYLAMRQLTGFDENRSFILISFVLLIYAGVLSLLLNLSLPVLNALLDQSAVI